MRALACASLLLLAHQGPDLAEDYRQLQDELSDPTVDAAGRLARLRAFLARHSQAAADRRVLAARIQLATALLQRLQPAAARMEFAAVLELAPAGDHDLRGRALYGIAQAQELEGDPGGARASLGRLLAEHEGTRYARLARLALARLESKDLAVGSPLPELRLGTDLHGNALRFSELRRAPCLLVFFDPEHEGSRRRLEALHRTWRAAGRSDKQFVAYALGADEPALRAMADRRGYPFSILGAGDDYLHPDVLALGVTGVPSSFLVGTGGLLVARDLPPDRLAGLLARSRGN